VILFDINQESVLNADGKPMTTESAPTSGSDPLDVLADAMDAAAQSTKDGIRNARSAVSDAVPVASQFLSQAVYKTCYTISYGVIFPSVLLARSLPKDNAAVHGLIDGAHAAIDMVNEMKPKSPSV
jgi:hypothetical protein